ncbi:MAG TPA: hypothetical protein VF898_14020 [Chloroflexota bacterium]
MRHLLLILIVALAGLGWIARSASTISYASHARTSTPRALVLEPFATQLGPGANAGDPEIQDLKAAGFQVDYLYDNQVTVQAMTTMSQYNVVYMRVHSDPTQTGDGVVATGQVVTNADDTVLAPMIQDGSIVKVKVSTATGESTESYYAITSAFLQKHTGQFPHDSVLFINGCAILKAAAFALAAQKQGVGVIVSWNNEAQDFDTYINGAALFAQMDQGLSVDAAIKALQAAGLGSSHPQGQDIATLGFIGDGTITLARAAAGVPAAPNTVTPVPTKSPATAQPSPTGTATATATPTTVAGPPLTVQLKPRVKPGTKQVVVIRSSPDTILHIRITFPDGEERTATTATDQSGVARYTFVQRPNRITRADLQATVIVQAVRNGATTTQSASYRIGWGMVDVSVLPRQQAVGKRVKIWVHSHARSLVTIHLRFPSGTTTKIQTTTGAGGWASASYRVGKYLKKPSNHIVVVNVSVQFPHRIRHGQTTFSIL